MLKDSDKALILVTAGIVTGIALISYHLISRKHNTASFVKSQSSELTTASVTETRTQNRIPRPVGKRVGAEALYPPADTPGRSDPNITQDNLDSTICRAGFSKAVRPARELMQRLKAERMTMSGANAAPNDYEFDHIIPIELGGCVYCKENLWLEPINDAKKKDLVENYLHSEVCGGRMSLPQAQSTIVADWYSIYLSITDNDSGRQNSVLSNDN